jgi:hypothetical protein
MTAPRTVQAGAFLIFAILIFMIFLGALATTAAGDLAWCTFLGTAVGEDALAVAAGSDGTVYVTGYTTSPGFPTTTGAYDTSYSNGGSNAFVARLSPYGNELVYSTYLGGGGSLSDTQEGWGIAVDGTGNAVVTGATSTGDFPTTPGVFDPSFNGHSDVFVVKLNPYGNTLRWGTFLGGNDLDNAWSVVLDEAGYVYVAGSTKSEDFPVTPSAFDTSFARGSHDAFVVKLNPSATTLMYGTYIGGTGWDHGQDICVDKSGNAYLGGRTASGNFPVTPGAWDSTLDGAADAFVAKLDPDGTGLDYATYLGGGDWDQVEGIAVDEQGQACVAGHTKSGDFPVTSGAYDEQHDGSYDDAFVTKLNATGTDLLCSTFLGGSQGDYSHDIAVDGQGRACVVGETRSEDFPTTAGAFDRTHNGGFDDAFVAVMDESGGAVEYSTFLGGGNGSGDRGNAVAIDGQGNAFAVGKTHCSDFPATSGAFDESYNGGWDGWVAKVNLGATAVETDAPVSQLPRGCLLHQNYPNPFNPVTEIRYRLSSPRRVTVKVYNIRGQEVAVLVDGARAAGEHAVRWDASGRAAGIYVCVLRAGQHRRTIRMVLLK